MGDAGSPDKRNARDLRFSNPAPAKAVAIPSAASAASAAIPYSSSFDETYKLKYLKHKNKYLELKKKIVQNN